MTVNEAVKQLRKESGDTWQSFAWRYQMALSSVANYESGKMRPCTAKLIRFYLNAVDLKSITAMIFYRAIVKDVGEQLIIERADAS